MDTALPTPPPVSDEYARYWRVWRSRGPGAAWYASKRAGAPEEWAPTLAADTQADLERQMASPPRRIRTALSDLVAPA